MEQFKEQLIRIESSSLAKNDEEQLPDEYDDKQPFFIEESVEEEASDEQSQPEETDETSEDEAGSEENAD